MLKLKKKHVILYLLPSLLASLSNTYNLIK